LSESEFIAMIAYTENAFQVQIADNEVPKMRLVGDLLKYIDSSHQQKNYI
jgi:acyl carrier protein